jgi:hypothetical protein
MFIFIFGVASFFFTPPLRSRAGLLTGCQMGVRPNLRSSSQFGLIGPNSFSVSMT